MKYNEETFEEGVDKAYQILWEMFNSSEDKESCEWDMGLEQKLLNILNAIDKEMGR